jgi:hypothetical protein
MKTRFAAIGAVLLSSAVAAPAFAAQLIDFSFSNSSANATGTFTLSDDATTVNGRQAYKVTGITGVRNGVAFTGLNPAFPTDQGGADNYIYLSGDPFTGLGVSYNLADMTYGNIYMGGRSVFEGTSTTLDASAFGNTVEFTTTNLRPATPVGGAVPEPATWAMMILGFGVVGVSMRRRKINTRVSFG